MARISLAYCISATGVAALMLLHPVAGYCEGNTTAVSAPRPHTSTLPDLKTDKNQLKKALDKAKADALRELQALGGSAAARVSKLSSLSAPRFLEELAVRPAVGPSTIAAPKPGASVPFPSVNTVGPNGGSTAGHPGVVLLLARLGDDDTYTAYCSGTLVQQNVILTATHCVCYAKLKADNYPTGKYCLNGTDLTAPAPLLDPSRWRVFFQYAGLRKVEKVEINDQYEFDDNAVRSDIALFVLSRAVNEINPPTLPSASDIASPWPGGAIVGFGLSANPKKPATNLLQELVLPGLKAQGEVQAAACTTQTYLDPKASLCSIFRGPNGQSAATVCKGDSGGPLWLTDQSGADIGITSGRNTDDCTAGNSVGFQMSTSYRPHWNWISSHLAAHNIALVKGRWPTFGQNLRFVLDKRSFGAFDKTGSYASDGWMTTTDGNPILGTLNSSGAINHFELQSREGKTLCTGVAGSAKKMPNVDYCWVSITAAQQFRVVAQGDPNEYLQFVVTTHASGTSFEE